VLFGFSWPLKHFYCYPEQKSMPVQAGTASTCVMDKGCNWLNQQQALLSYELSFFFMEQPTHESFSTTVI
jgi:hypothetical protein